MFGRYTGERPLALAWTGLAAVVLAVTLPELRPAIDPALGESLASPGPPARRAGAVAGAWVAGLVVLRLRERRGWRRLAAGSRFGFQGDGGGTYPPLQATIRGRTVTAEAGVPGLLSRVHTTVSTSVDGVHGPVRVRIRHVGAGADGDGLTVGNPSIDRRFVVAGATERWVEHLLTPEVQSVLMDVETHGEVRVTERSVAVRIPSTRLSATELGHWATAVATLSNRLEAVPG